MIKVVISLFLVIFMVAGCVSTPEKDLVKMDAPDKSDSPQTTEPNSRLGLILLDPGHGGEDPGAIGYNGNEEKNLNLSLALAIKEELKKRGFQVAMTRNKDISLSLKERANIINNCYPDLFLCIHHNSCNNPKVSGVETFYFLTLGPTKMGALSHNYAQAVQEAMHKETKSPNRGVKTANYFLLRNAIVPAILIEAGFISNSVEECSCADSYRQTKVAQAIAEAVTLVYDQNQNILNGK